MRKAEDLTGQRFGKLVVIRPDESIKTKRGAKRNKLL